MTEIIKTHSPFFIDFPWLACGQAISIYWITAYKMGPKFQELNSREL